MAAYTDLNRTLDFSVNISATQWPDADLEMAQKFFKSSIHSIYDRVDMLQEGIHEIHKRKLIYFEFESRVNGNRMTLGEQQPVFRYTYIQYLVEADRTLVFTLLRQNHRRKIGKRWLRAVMKTIKIK
ncbi:MAG: hypothetical protein U5K54_26560 [Cytophagales bacterium]|nr:hypothetical protein [Cytophagales bacterium]